jgi:hypothetical protein
MRPRLLAQARLSGMRRVTPATDFGWAVTQPGEGTVSLFDRDLRAVATVPIPFDAPAKAAELWLTAWPQVGRSGGLVAADLRDERRLTCAPRDNEGVSGIRRWSIVDRA